MNINGTKYYELKAYTHNTIQAVKQHIKTSKRESVAYHKARGRLEAYEDALVDLEKIYNYLRKLEEK